MQEQRPLVGVGVMVFKDGKILLGKRKGSHGAGQWAFPGGHLEYMESFEECAARESKEECGVEIQNITFLHVINSKAYAPKHYIHIGMVAEWLSGKPHVLEPEKSECWQWFDLDALPEPLFDFCKHDITFYRLNHN